MLFLNFERGADYGCSRLDSLDMDTFQVILAFFFESRTIDRLTFAEADISPSGANRTALFWSLPLSKFQLEFFPIFSSVNFPYGIFSLFRKSTSIEMSVTARSRSGLWLQTTEDRERTRRQSEIPQILF